MTTEVRIRVLSLDYRLRMQIQDEVNSRYIMYEPKAEGKMLTFRIDDEVTREGIISALSEGVLEYVDTIEVGEPPKAVQEEPDNPFKTADTFL